MLLKRLSIRRNSTENFTSFENYVKTGVSSGNEQMNSNTF